MPTLSEYVNVYNTALQVLDSKGYQLWHNPEAGLFFAERGGWDFAADNPISLLGVIAIYEHTQPESYREYWWRGHTHINHLNLPKEPPAQYKSVMPGRHSL